MAWMIFDLWWSCRIFSWSFPLISIFQESVRSWLKWRSSTATDEWLSKIYARWTTLPSNNQTGRINMEASRRNTHTLDIQTIGKLLLWYVAPLRTLFFILWVWIGDGPSSTIVQFKSISINILIELVESDAWWYHHSSSRFKCRVVVLHSLQRRT